MEDSTVGIVVLALVVLVAAAIIAAAIDYFRRSPNRQQQLGDNQPMLDHFEKRSDAKSEMDVSETDSIDEKRVS